MWRIPLSDLAYDEQEEQAVLGVLRSRWLTMGPLTEQFESAMAGYLGVRHAIAVANCTSALELAYYYVLRLKNSDREHTLTAKQAVDEVLVPDITFAATASAAIFAGGKPLLSDIASLDKPVLHMEHVQTMIAQRRNIVRVICSVHYAGFEAATKFKTDSGSTNIAVIEDAAHGIGGRAANGRFLGTNGLIGCFSFFSNKNLATGEGGLLATDDDEAAAALRLLRSHGMTSSTYQRHISQSHGYDVLMPGRNNRCTEITAALGLEQLTKLDAGNQRRRAIYRLYRDAFSVNHDLITPFGQDEAAIGRSACHIFPLVCSSTLLRDRVRAALNQAGIQTSFHYPALHTLTAFKSLDNGNLTTSDNYASRQITLPLYPGLTNGEVEEITNRVLRSASKPV